MPVPVVPPAQPTDNTWLFLGIGAIAAVLIGAVIIRG
jgi:uncharacterized membrane-anchored protein YhcB (DUF1043 family)